MYMYPHVHIHRHIHVYVSFSHTRIFSDFQIWKSERVSDFHFQIHAHTHVHAYVDIHIHTHTHTHTCTHILMYTHIYTQTYIHTYVHTYMDVHTSTHRHINTHLYTHTSTHTQTYCTYCTHTRTLEVPLNSLVLLSKQALIFLLLASEPESGVTPGPYSGPQPQVKGFRHSERKQKQLVAVWDVYWANQYMTLAF